MSIPKCDGRGAGGLCHGTGEAGLTPCTCARCAREPDAIERFHTCGDLAHIAAAGAKHLQVRGRYAVWGTG